MNGRTGSTDDAAVVLEMAAGSEAALETLYDRYATSIFAAAYRLTSDRGTAEEVVQETFLALWNRAETFDPKAGSLAAWLHAIARNRTIDRLRAAGTGAGAGVRDGRGPGGDRRRHRGHAGRRAHGHPARVPGGTLAIGDRGPP